jgi:putative FmdB family regulatory protein
MPTYEYECESPPHHRFEQFQRFSDPPVETCPACGATVHRVIHATGVIFKGPGFYKTDNAPKAATVAKDAKPAAKDKGAKAEPSASAPAASASET